MTEMTVEHVETLTEVQIEAATQMCDRCYYGDVSIKALIGGNWDIHADYWRSLIRAGLLEGRVYVLKNQDDEIVSIGVWFEAGNNLFNTEAQRALGFNDFFTKLTPEAQEWWSQCEDVMAKLWKKGWTKEEKAHRWWCVNLATDPEYQGRGYATRIVEQTSKEAKENGCILGLATGLELNVRATLKSPSQ
ncbi:hypothetical protein J3R30DRAFT_3699410 [Lentinula aciculospora]|uniref:N-acetyltransferase domain-containing protein n=1 Tax=Lentinula aciculospora TaxID=153920 RepID=A0A9W9AI09_9AGAR|nr:hypothetical protein J3R30DRAFT_3699410 [Lentinula aciculospora]